MIIIIIICLHYISIVYLVKCEARRFHNNIQKDLCPPRRTLLFSTEHPRQSFCDLCTLAPRTTDNRPPHCSRGCKIILSFHLLFKPCWWWWWGGDGTRRLVQGSYIRGIPATHCLLKFKSAAMLCQPNKQKRIGERERETEKKRKETKNRL